MNDRTGNNTHGGGKRSGGHGSRGAAIAGVLGIDWHAGNHGRGWWCDLGFGQSARMERNDTWSFRRRANGGWLRGDGSAYSDVVDGDRISAGGTQRAGLGVMRFLLGLGARLGGCETTEGAGVMAGRAPYIRAGLLAALMLIGLQWLFADWMASIEARLWLYEHLSGWKR